MPKIEFEIKAQLEKKIHESFEEKLKGGMVKRANKEFPFTLIILLISM